MNTNSDINLRLVIDVSHSFQTGMNTGIQRVLRQFISSLKIQNREFILVWHPYGTREAFYDVTDFYDTMSSSFFHKFYKNFINKYSFRFIVFYKFQKSLFNFSFYKKLIDRVKLNRLLSEGLSKYTQENRDVLVAMDVFWHDDTLTDQILKCTYQGLRLIIFIHDLFPLTNPEWFEKSSCLQFSKNMKRAMSVSNGVLTSSEMNFREIESYFYNNPRYKNQDCLKWINPGVDHLKLPMNFTTGLNKGLVWVGTIEPRKNIKFLIEFIERYNPEFPIFVIGKIGWKSFNEVGQLRRLNKSRKITWLQNCSDEELVEVLNNCEIGLITSKNEGYGFVLYEFLSLNLRVIAPKIKVFSEQKFEGVEFYEPNNIEDLAKVCLSKNNNRVELNFGKLPSWNSFTDQFWDFASKTS